MAGGPKEGGSHFQKGRGWGSSRNVVMCSTFVPTMSGGTYGSPRVRFAPTYAISPIASERLSKRTGEELPGAGRSGLSGADASHSSIKWSRHGARKWGVSK
jgi:hypothetical protein